MSLVQLRNRMQYWVERGEHFKVARYVFAYRDHVSPLIDIAQDDKVSAHARQLHTELSDIGRSLMRMDIHCAEAWLIFTARVDSFVLETLEPWVKVRFGKECVETFYKTPMGKA